MDWLVPDCYKRVTPNRYHALYKPEKIEPIEAVVYHYTASIGTSGTLNWLLDHESRASAHFLVARDGTLYQLVSLLERAWHAGGATSTLFGKNNVNGRTIGVEIMNAGPLFEVNGKIYTVAENKEFKGFVGITDSTKHQYKLWEKYPDTQIDVVCDITNKLLEEFPIIKTEPLARMIGHEDVDPTRKIDPGGMFPWDLIRGLAV